MGRRSGTVDPRARVAVSKSMADLRRMQWVLNGFWQTSELAYGYMLAELGSSVGQPDRPTIEVLGHIESEVWFPNNQGKIKRTDSMGTTLKQVRENTVHAYRATLLSFFSAFEAYLETEVDHLKPPKLRWGEYVRSLSNPSLRSAACALQLRTILCADFCREVRNQLLHELFTVPDDATAEYLAKWKDRLTKRAVDAGWPAAEVDTEIKYTFNQVIGQAVNHVDQAKAAGKELPIELFYMLFTFTNLDNLAFAIEEALQPQNSRTGFSVTRKRDAIRRTDLIIEEAEASGATQS